MLGFSAISETPISQATTSSDAFTALASGTASLSVSNVLFDAEANIVTDSIPVTFSLNIAFDAKANLTLSNTSSSISVNSFSSLNAKANTTLNNVIADFSEGQLVGTGVAVLTLPNTDSSLSFGTLSFDAQATSLLPTVLTSFEQGLLTPTGVANITTPSIDSSFATPSLLDTDAQANITISAVENIISVNAFESVKGAANKVLTTADATTLIHPFENVKGSANTILENLLLPTSVNLDDPVAVKFDYASLADSYERSRVIYLLAYASNAQKTTVHIAPENRSILIEPLPRNNTVYIAA